MNVTVEAISKYGILHDGKWINFGDGGKFKGEMFVKGAQYELETEPGKKGGLVMVKVTPVSGKPVPAATHGRRSADNGLSKEEWHDKDVRISRQGVIQAAVIALGPSSTSEESLFVAAEGLANKMLEFVNRK